MKSSYVERGFRKSFSDVLGRKYGDAWLKLSPRERRRHLNAEFEAGGGRKRILGDLFLKSAKRKLVFSRAPGWTDGQIAVLINMSSRAMFDPLVRQRIMRRPGPRRTAERSASADRDSEGSLRNEAFQLLANFFFAAPESTVKAFHKLEDPALKTILLYRQATSDPSNHPANGVIRPTTDILPETIDRVWCVEALVSVCGMPVHEALSRWNKEFGEEILASSYQQDVSRVADLNWRLDISGLIASIEVESSPLLVEEQSETSHESLRRRGRPPGRAIDLQSIQSALKHLTQVYFEEFLEGGTKSPRPTLVDVADHLNVSASTIQRVLRQANRTFTDLSRASGISDFC